MILAAKIEKMTGDDFLPWDEQHPDRREFIGGEVFAMVGATRPHATVAESHGLILLSTNV